MTKKGSFLNGSIALIRHPGNLQAGVQKYLKAYGCLIKDFRHDKKEGSFLNVSTRGPNYLRTKAYGGIKSIPQWG